MSALALLAWSSVSVECVRAKYVRLVLSKRARVPMTGETAYACVAILA